MEDPEGIETVVDGHERYHRKGYRAKKKLASTLLKSELRELQSHIRARVSSMLMKLLDVRLVRLVRNN